MKNYTITVNGNVYDVTVEENQGGNVAATPVKRTMVKAAAPAIAKVEKATGGSVKIEAGAAGKVFKVESKVGASVKKGDAIVILEAMKMEIPVVAPVDGVVASIDVSVGQAVEGGALLATLN